MSEQRLIAIEEVLRELVGQSATLAAKVDAVDTKVGERVKEGAAFRELIQESVFDERHGLAVRVDRLEQAHKGAKARSRWFWGSFFATAGAWVWTKLAG